MKSLIQSSLSPRYSPVAILLSNEKPEQSLQFIEGRRGCVISMLQAAAKGRTITFDRKTCGCIGGGTGLGFGDTYKNFPGGIEYFLSTGNQDFCQSDTGKAIIQNWPRLAHGEAYKKTPALAKSFFDELPYADVPYQFVIFKPVEQVTKAETPEVVVFLVTPDQLTALTVLANYGRHGGNNVISPWGAGCHSIFLLPFHEKNSGQERAVIGLMDISARKFVDADILSFSIPYGLFMEMEKNAPESFLSHDEWQSLKKRNSSLSRKPTVSP